MFQWYCNWQLNFLPGWYSWSIFQFILGLPAVQTANILIIPKKLIQSGSLRNACTQDLLKWPMLNLAFPLVSCQHLGRFVSQKEECFWDSLCVFLLLRARERGLRRLENLDAGTLKGVKMSLWIKRFSTLIREKPCLGSLRLLLESIHRFPSNSSESLMSRPSAWTPPVTVSRPLWTSIAWLLRPLCRSGKLAHWPEAES